MNKFKKRAVSALVSAVSLFSVSSLTLSNANAEIDLTSQKEVIESYCTIREDGKYIWNDGNFVDGHQAYGCHAFAIMMKHGICGGTPKEGKDDSWEKIEGLDYSDLEDGDIVRFKRGKDRYHTIFITKAADEEDKTIWFSDANWTNDRNDTNIIRWNQVLNDNAKKSFGTIVYVWRNK